MKLETGHTFRRLLISQLALILVYPLLGDVWGLHFLLGIFLVVALYGGVSVTLRKPLKLWISSVLGVCFVGSYWIETATGIHAFSIAGPVFGAAFFWFIAAVMMSYVFLYRSRVDMDLIYGAISVYLLIGSAFTEMYVALSMMVPGTFSGVDETLGFDAVSRALSYFSFVTLTTLGYGDITPVRNYARVLAYLEAIIGQLYLTILVARLVGTYIAQSRPVGVQTPDRTGNDGESAGE